MQKNNQVEIVVGHSSRDYEYLLAAFRSMWVLAIVNGDTKREARYAKNIELLESANA